MTDPINRMTPSARKHSLYAMTRSSFEPKLEAFGRLVATPQLDHPNVAGSVPIGSIETVAHKGCRA